MIGFSELAIMHIILHISCVFLVFWLLQSTRIEQIFKKGATGKIQLFVVILSVVMGSLLSNYIMDFFRLVQEAAVMF